MLATSVTAVAIGAALVAADHEGVPGSLPALGLLFWRAATYLAYLVGFRVGKKKREAERKKNSDDAPPTGVITESL